MPRPLTPAELARLRREQAKYERTQAALDERKARSLLARDQIVTAVLAAGGSPSELARELGVSRGAIYVMQARAERLASNDG